MSELHPRTTSLRIGGYPVRTQVFIFDGFAIIASAVRPDEDVIHVGGTHNDSIFPPQRWTSLQDAIEKIRAKAVDMETKTRIHQLPYAGCKFGIIADEVYLVGPKRIELFQRLGEVLNYYGGRLRTGADANTDLFDLMVAWQVSEFALGKPINYGGCGDPSLFTAQAIVEIQRRIIPLIAPHSPTMDGKRIAVKGAAGKVGRHVVSLLHNDVSMAVADIPQKDSDIRDIIRTYPGVEKKSAERIHETDAHIFCPCDTTITIPNRKIVRQFNCKAIVGSANDQNRQPELEDALWARGILHPSMNGALENGAGLLAVTDELEEGGFSKERLERKIEELVAKTFDICREALARNIPPYKIVQERYLN